MAGALIVGLGREGLALARYLSERGTAVTVADGRKAEDLGESAEALTALGGNLIAGSDHPDLAGFEILYLNPAVPKDAPVVRDAQARGIPISALTDLFFAVCPAPIAGVTGSNGKTTTTTLLGAMAAAAGFTTYVGGNIGRPLLNETTRMTARDWVVLEMSSFQLEWLQASPRVAVITNLTPNHLDRHHTLDEYAAAKLPIVRYQDADGCAVLNLDDPFASRFAQIAGGRVVYFSLVSAPPDGAALEDDMLVIRHAGRGEPVCGRADLRVPGAHNVANALAALAAADAMGVPAGAMREAIRAFTGVPHRLELVRVLDHVSYYNDSIATSPDRTRAALAALPGPVVLILGGHDKVLPWEALSREAAARCRAVLVLGEAEDLIVNHLETALRRASPGLLTREALIRCGDLDRAVSMARQWARAGDAVLLSPGCASYDQFRHFEERGDRFRQLVGGLHGDQ
ncbi:MAG TPA: UDP-N-acetylmuramoyl-L-alanine--D-glutamate ligase [Chloroflexota bacterium]|nr:UDP-N-acetylmuramoyl-L-alanine--D-glutamate ligase [Chloroflexota bacterium]